MPTNIDEFDFDFINNNPGVLKAQRFYKLNHEGVKLMCFFENFDNAEYYR